VHGVGFEPTRISPTGLKSVALDQLGHPCLKTAAQAIASNYTWRRVFKWRRQLFLWFRLHQLLPSYKRLDVKKSFLGILERIVLKFQKIMLKKSFKRTMYRNPWVIETNHISNALYISHIFQINQPRSIRHYQAIKHSSIPMDESYL
jgi:hypothetical protein